MKKSWRFIQNNRFDFLTSANEPQLINPKGLHIHELVTHLKSIIYSINMQVKKKKKTKEASSHFFNKQFPFLACSILLKTYEHKVHCKIKKDKTVAKMDGMGTRTHI